MIIAARYEIRVSEHPKIFLIIIISHSFPFKFSFIDIAQSALLLFPIFFFLVPIIASFNSYRGNQITFFLSLFLFSSFYYTAKKTHYIIPTQYAMIILPAYIIRGRYTTKNPPAVLLVHVITSSFAEPRRLSSTRGLHRIHTTGDHRAGISIVKNYTLRTPSLTYNIQPSPGTRILL